jgi:DNA repair protein RadC
VYFGYPKVNVIKSSKDAFLHFKDLGFSATEIFAVLFFDIANRVITFKRLMKARKISIHSSPSQRIKKPWISY